MSGSLVCVGTGMTLGAHISPIAKSHIEQADIVFSLMANGFAEKWLEGMNDDVRTLQGYYQEGKNRNITYNEMVEAILTQVREGKKSSSGFLWSPRCICLC
jgi:precorrin-3B methylase